MLPYQGDKGFNLLKSMKRYVKLKITFIGNKLSSCFSVKGKIRFEHQHDLIYYENSTILL